MDSELRRIASGKVRRLSRRNFQRLCLEKLECRSSTAAILPLRLITSILGFVSNTSKDDSSIMRLIFSRVVPWNPVATEKNGKDVLDGYLLVAPKDLEVLPLTLFALWRTYGHTLFAITVVAPEAVLEQVNSIIQILELNKSVEVISDEMLLSQFNLTRSDFVSGHPIMQIMKFICALHSTCSASIIFDGDTLFLKSKSWISSRGIHLILSQENHQMHRRFNIESAGLRSDSGFGFTTQAQALLKDYVVELSNEFGGVRNLALIFNKTCSDYYSNISSGKFPSELQLYGDWVIERKSQTPILSANKNISIARSEFQFALPVDFNVRHVEFIYESLISLCPNAGSISLHAYK
jgi:hypothetical protein